MQRDASVFGDAACLSEPEPRRPPHTMPDTQSDTPSDAAQNTAAIRFEDFGLSADILRALADQGYVHPTPIQAAAIPVVLQGRDVMGAAQTGTGKTAGFSLPIIQRLLANASTSASAASTWRRRRPPCAPASKS